MDEKCPECGALVAKQTRPGDKDRWKCGSYPPGGSYTNPDKECVQHPGTYGDHGHTYDTLHAGPSRWCLQRSKEQAQGVNAKLKAAIEWMRERAQGDSDSHVHGDMPDPTIAIDDWSEAHPIVDAHKPKETA